MNPSLPLLRTRVIDERARARLQAEGLHPLLARLYAARGINSKAALPNSLQQLLPPETLLGIQNAANLLADCIAHNQRIVVVADYDCDGATACAVAIRGLRALGAQARNVDYIVPNRALHGYGLTPEIVQLAHAKQAQLLITVDNGIASTEGVASANELGMRVLITDHHLPGATIPPAAAIVNPNQTGCTFASKNLAGVGVMFYVLLATRAEMRARAVFSHDTQPRLDALLDLVALGTVADLVKLDANNRLLVAQGLQRMRAGKLHAGLAALFRVAGRDAAHATTFDLGFALGPRVNAAGRLEDMGIGIECLLCDESGRAYELAQQLDAINQERRSKEALMQNTALTLAEDTLQVQQATLALFDETWHAGIVGLVAGKLKEKYWRPAIAFALAQHEAKTQTVLENVDAESSRLAKHVELRGSARSIAGFHMRDALDLVSKRHPDLIDKFGGHAMAAGLTIQRKNLAAFCTAFEQVGQEWLTAEARARVVASDGALEQAHLRADVAQLLDAQVWGQGFEAPVFSAEFAVLSQRIVKDKHLKLLLQQNGASIEAIWFNHSHSLPARAHLAYRLAVNDYLGQQSVQLIIEHEGNTAT